MQSTKEEKQFAQGLNTLYIISKVLQIVIEQIRNNSQVAGEIKRMFNRLALKVQSFTRDADIALIKRKKINGKTVIDRSEKEQFDNAASIAVELINISLAATKSQRDMELRNEIERLKTKYYPNRG
jgi:hypothetical protein